MRPLFDADAMLAGSPKVAGELAWVDEGMPITGISAQGDRLDISTKSPLTIDSEHVFLSGYGFQIDGFFKVESPTSGVVSIEFGGGLSENAKKRALKRLAAGPHGKLHEPTSYDILTADFLDARGTLELNQLMFDAAELAKVRMGYEKFEEAAAESQLKILSLMESFKIAESDRVAFQASLESLFSFKSEADAAMQIARIKKDFGIRAKSFSGEAWAFAEKNRQLAIESAGMTGYVEKVTEPELELRKREIEIMCAMPRGLMSALDNTPQISQRIAEMFLYLRKALSDAAKGQSGGTASEKKDAA